MTRRAFGIIVAYALATGSVSMLIGAMAGLTWQLSFQVPAVLGGIPLGYWLAKYDAARRREAS